MSRKVMGSGVVYEPDIRLPGTPSGRRSVERFSPLADSSGNKSKAGFSSTGGGISGSGADSASSAGFVSRNQSSTFQPLAINAPPRRSRGGGESSTYALGIGQVKNARRWRQLGPRRGSHNKCLVRRQKRGSGLPLPTSMVWNLIYGVYSSTASFSLESTGR